MPVFYWTDSTCVLGWIQREPQSLPVFVKNRVQEIQMSVEKGEQFCFCPGVANPADLSTRGMSASELSRSSLWWKGPDWLGYPSQWPQCPETYETSTHEDTNTAPVTTLLVQSDPDLFIEEYLESTCLKGWISYLNPFLYDQFRLHDLTENSFFFFSHLNTL